MLISAFSMVALGGITRLRGAGLSMISWHLFRDMLPPCSEKELMPYFLEYMSSPEYKQINIGMTIQEFKSIFWLEYTHRLLARLFGIFYLIPLGIWWKVLPKQEKKLLLLGCFFVALQGAMGFYMVKSGLHDVPYVSPFRLSAHFFVAVMIIICLWHTLYIRRSYKIVLPSVPIYFLGILIVITAFYGTLVAGLKAGRIYMTFPLMGEELIPCDIRTCNSIWWDLVHHPVCVQWVHRVLAISTLIYTFYICRQYNYYRSLFVLVVLQCILGITTLVTGADYLAVLHQLSGVSLLCCVSRKIYISLCPNIADDTGKLEKN